MFLFVRPFIAMISNTSDQEEAEGRKGRGVWKGKKMKITKIKLKLRQVIFFFIIPLPNIHS